MDEMMIGNPDLFAIETSIFEAYDSPGQMALGCFVLHVGGFQYGYREPDSTIIGTSFNAIRRRIADRGNHKSPLPSDAHAAEIATAVSRANSLDDMEDKHLYGVPWLQFFKLLNVNDCILAPDNEQGFDDGSHVLHFDDESTVRLVAFRMTSSYVFEKESLRDVRISQDNFYAILEEWHKQFEKDWISSPKVA